MSTSSSFQRTSQGGGSLKSFASPATVNIHPPNVTAIHPIVVVIHCSICHMALPLMGRKGSCVNTTYTPSDISEKKVLGVLR